jgi:hypothetical protein
MTASAAFAAALTTFLIVAWMAGETHVSGAVQEPLVPPTRMGDRRGRSAPVPESVRAVLRHRTLGISA